MRAVHGFLDIHLHLLPGVDDGPRDEAAALAHADLLARDGVRRAVVTPHVGHPAFAVRPDEIAARTARLQRAIDDAGIVLRLHPGGELHPAAARSVEPAVLAAIAQGPSGDRWVLLEVPFAGIGEEFLAACARIRSLGYQLVIAHPERAAGFLPAGLEALAGELARGAVLQVSVDSLLGHHGPAAVAGAAAILWRRLPAVVASDGHGGRRRQTLLDGRQRLLRDGSPTWWVREWTQRAPHRLLADGPGALTRPPAVRAVA